MNDFTRGVCFALILTMFGYTVYECGKMNGRIEEKRKRKIKETPIIIIENSKKESEQGLFLFIAPETIHIVKERRDWRWTN